MDPNQTTSRPKSDPYALAKTENRSDRRFSRRRNGVAERSGQHLPGARQTFVGRTAAHNRQIADLKLTAPQRRALDAVALENSALIARGSIITDAMFSKLEGLGLVKVDVTRPHRAALTDLGMAYVRRAPKGGKR